MVTGIQTALQEIVIRDSGFSKEIKEYLGKYKILHDISDYGHTEGWLLVCEDGRTFEERITKYGIRVNPYQDYADSMQKLIQQIKDAMWAKLPYMDKKMREKKL